MRRVRKQTPRLKGGRYERDAADMDGRPISMAFPLDEAQPEADEVEADEPAPEPRVETE